MYESLKFSVERILPHGLFILARSGKIGKKISDRHVAVATAIKDKSRRLETFEKHLFMNKCLKVKKGVYQKYVKLNPKKRDGYKAKHAEEIRLYEEARDYFKAVMNGRNAPLHIKNW